MIKLEQPTNISRNESVRLVITIPVQAFIHLEPLPSLSLSISGDKGRIFQKIQPAMKIILKDIVYSLFGPNEPIPENLNIACIQKDDILEHFETNFDYDVKDINPRIVRLIGEEKLVDGKVVFISKEMGDFWRNEYNEDLAELEKKAMTHLERQVDGKSRL